MYFDNTDLLSRPADQQLTAALVTLRESLDLMIAANSEIGGDRDASRAATNVIEQHKAIASDCIAVISKANKALRRELFSYQSGKEGSPNQE